MLKKFFFLFFAFFYGYLFAIVDTEAKSNGIYEDLEFSIESEKGNSDTLEYDFSSYTTYFLEKEYWLLDLSYNLEKANSINTKNKAYLHLRNVINFYEKKSDSALNKIDFEYFGQIENNEFQLLKIRALAGVGLRFKPIKNYEFFLGIGSMLMRETYLNDEKNKIFGRINTYLAIENSLTEKIAIGYIGYYQPKINEFSDYESKHTFTLNVDISKNLKLQNKIIYIYDSNPVGHVRIYDLEQKTSLIFSF